MKKILIISVTAALFQVLFLPNAVAQYRGARDYTKRLNPILPPPRQPAASPTVAPGQRPVATPRAVDPEKAKAEKAEMTKRLVQFQKEQAEAGSPVYQYELGLRYLTGDGVEKDPATGKGWLEKSAKKGNPDAVKKLEALRKLEAEKPVDNKISAPK